MKHAPSYLAVLALGLGAAACGEDSGGSGSGSGADGARSKTTATGADAFRGVVRVQGEFSDRESDATGVVYDAERGLVLSANHPVEGARRITVTAADGRPLIAQNVARAQCRDLAVLRLQDRPADLGAMRFGNSDAVRAGEEVKTLSFTSASADGKAQATSLRGSVASVGIAAKLHPRLPRFAPLVAHQTPVTPAGSGSPTVNARGEVVGINALVSHRPGTDIVEGVAYAQPSNYIRSRLGELRPGNGRAFEGWAKEHRCHQAIEEISGEGHDFGSSAASGSGSSSGSSHQESGDHQ